MTFDSTTPTFQTWGKIPRLNRDIVITEKIDGSNAAIGVLDDGTVYAQSRKRLITPQEDNAGFARWVADNEDVLRSSLGYGLHFGEWWGRGIQRNYGQTEKFFSLFNTARWGDLHESSPLWGINVRSVPVLYEGPFDQEIISGTLKMLALVGSIAAPGFADPEGIIIFHTAANSMWKVTVKDDEKPKGSSE